MLSYNVINIVDSFLNVYADKSSEETKKSEKEKKKIRIFLKSFFVCVFGWLVSASVC